jgi:quercetin dioxygenase-like cupin family protein
MMSGNSNPDGRQSTSMVFSPQKNLHPINLYLTELSENAEEYCVMHCTLPAGLVVPLHSHADRETFYVMSGKIEALNKDRWQELGPGDVFDVRDGMKHAWRNSSQAAVSVLCVTTTRVAKFLRATAASPEDVSAPAEHVQRFRRLVEEHGYWLASPEENAAVGLHVNWNGFDG